MKSPRWRKINRLKIQYTLHRLSIAGFTRAKQESKVSANELRKVLRDNKGSRS